jgi:hypothetical protein
MAPKKKKYPIFNHPRYDASENIFARRELENVRAKAFDVKYPEFKARRLIPIDHSVHTGAETTTFYTMDEFGQAKVGGGYQTEAPRVDVSLTDATLRIRPLTAAYGYSLQEIRNAMFSGRSLPQMKANASRRIIEQGFDQILLLGDSNWGLSGLFTLSGTTTHTPANGALGSPLWSLKTADEMVADLHGVVNQIVTDTLDVEHPNTLILPLTAWNTANETRMGDGSDATVLTYFLRTSPHVTEVESSTQLESNAAWTGRRMVAYTKSPDHLQGVIPQEYEQLPPEPRGFETVVNCHARCGGVEVYYPKSVGYADGF